MPGTPTSEPGLAPLDNVRTELAAAVAPQLELAKVAGLHREPEALVVLQLMEASWHGVATHGS